MATTIADDLLNLAGDAAATLEALTAATTKSRLPELRRACDDAKDAWSGSNLGYHAEVYFSGLTPPPPGVQFNPEWGLLERLASNRPHPGWQVFDRKSAMSEILERAGVGVDVENIKAALAAADTTFVRLKERAISLLTLQRKRGDPYVQRKLDQMERLISATPDTIAPTLVGSNRVSRDSKAVTQGLRVAPHQALQAVGLAVTVVENGLAAIRDCASDASFHLQRADQQSIALVPASDRIVALDHNSEAYAQTMEMLEKLERSVEEANDYPDVADKQQRVAELSAAQRLLRAARVRLAALKAILEAPLRWLMEKFAGGFIGQLAIQAWNMIKSLLF